MRQKEQDPANFITEVHDMKNSHKTSIMRQREQHPTNFTTEVHDMKNPHKVS